MPDSGLSILLDQNVPQECTGWLQRMRPAWTVSHVNLINLMGRPDAEVFRWAQTNRAVIVSYDEDFADARTFPLGAIMASSACGSGPRPSKRPSPVCSGCLSKCRNPISRAISSSWTTSGSGCAGPRRPRNRSPDNT